MPVATVTEVTLVESAGSGQVNSTVEALGGGEYVVHFDRIPSVEFVVLVKGQNDNSISRASSGIFQRQSTTSLRALLSMLLFLFLDAGGSANGTVNITAPPNTPSGTVITLTIEALAPSGADSDYAVLHLTVLPTVTDFTPPVCKLLSLNSDCPKNCKQSMWDLSVQVTDGVNGTGVDRVSLREGSGALNISMAAGNENVTLVPYVASCCSPDVQLVAVDQVGNVEICRYSGASWSSRVDYSILLCFTLLSLSLQPENVII
ncbi:uncharacterized protein LOC124876959 [Girardinichthys multiradiatus]|uniref:uncharacterized protein LOC124876959 n=1 Tax=Girardinichthys multiradiatus TaxID=208333 RepID=UPI001FABD7B4|nr:uncharacterized protein LOC124876959 [Girardinichthys multiradiatus]